ncbi:MULTISPECIES: succinate dehydrogenase flavoprotein subunit [Staphylococcus]|uniref:succinate dehydrogenase n=2 Tax=Staphylococcus TaxID=1279 RepID=A0ABN0PAZ8_STASI|nr:MULTISPECIES: succinate dehydrogenase flavoprotein subunit [Staphylococcus]AMG96417.1 succinate dehydrogenase flavoprotein subunit [Staphylococcus simulans]AVO02532.1 succinate dehydrogenase flavoprotein subunit [Staphylococcus simulans]AVO05477.1 succinate dehydrogenase flavoprotein subunit [Staphylococcus simulans]AWG19079.1 succinate dehydrogenase flavoprotein subunit [Staphylococcus simulans]AWI02028.1 succinate dehydrogenase flavoprotein subunit [Staphylococcus simulans]
MAEKKVIVVGGGLAGLMSTIKIAEQGVHVDLFSVVPVKRSHSVCAQGGINGAVNTKGEGDSPWIHFDDTVYGGDFLANQPPVKAMADAAPKIIHLLDRMGVMFNRTPEGLLDFRRFGGTLHHRTAYAGATTGQQLLYALDEQVRKFEVDGLVTKYEGWEFLGVVKDENNAARGIVAQNLTDAKIDAFRSDAVVMATGGPGIIFGKTTNSMINTGSAASIVYQQGAVYANGEFIQIHPTAIPGDDKLRLMSESARGEGGRIWTYKDGKPWYFLEEKYPDYGNLVPRDIATREIFDVCVNQKLGINGENMVYLDLSHKDPHELDVKLGGIIEIYEKFTGDDPRKVPMKIFPAVHYSMGGLYVDYDQMTTIDGLFAAGECDFSQHGGNRLGANSLLSAIYGGTVAGPNAVKYIDTVEHSYTELDDSLYQDLIDKEQKRFDDLLNMRGTENAFKLHRELGEIMTKNVTVVRDNKRLLETDEKILELMRRYQDIDMEDTQTWSNQAVFFTRQLWNMLVLARVITIGAYNRNESRGAHYKPEFPDRNDEEWLKTTKAFYEGIDNPPRFEYEDVDISLIPPRKRDYSSKSKSSKEDSSKEEGSKS